MIKRLQGALASAKVKQIMKAEDEILEELKAYQRIIAEKEEAIEEQDRTIEEQDRTIEEQDRTIEEKDRTIDEKNKIIHTKDEIIEKAIVQMYEAGISLTQIAKTFSLSVDEVQQILN